MRGGESAGYEEREEGACSTRERSEGSGGTKKRSKKGGAAVPAGAGHSLCDLPGS